MYSYKLLTLFQLRLLSLFSVEEREYQNNIKEWRKLCQKLIKMFNSKNRELKEEKNVKILCSHINNGSVETLP